MYSRVFAHFMPHALPMTCRSMNPFATASALIFLNSAAVTGLRGAGFAGLAASAVSNAARLALAFSNCFAVKAQHAARA